MTLNNIYLLKLIKDSLSTEEICNKLNISTKQLKRRLESIKYDGYNIDKILSYNGSYKYGIDYSLNNDKEKVIHDVDNEFRFVAISDTHIGHSRECMDYIYKIYEYSYENDINIIFHLGDLLEGVFQSKFDHKEQIDYFLRNYPYVPDILTFMVFGNHEEEFLTESGYNLNTIIDNNRDDIIPLGYGQSILNVNNNKIFLSHQKNFDSEYGLKLTGHSHRFKFIMERSGPIIVVPTLSNYLHTSDYPGALDLDIKIDNKGNFDKMSLKHLTINENKIRETSFLEFPFKRDQGVKRVR